MGKRMGRAGDLPGEPAFLLVLGGWSCPSTVQLCAGSKSYACVRATVGCHGQGEDVVADAAPLVWWVAMFRSASWKSSPSMIREDFGFLGRRRFERRDLQLITLIRTSSSLSAAALAATSERAALTGRAAWRDTLRRSLVPRWGAARPRASRQTGRPQSAVLVYTSSDRECWLFGPG
jgi:hypothetical protein